jgi:membrane associated rhomboid family serine protease
MQQRGMMFPYRVWHQREYHTLFTSGFLHANGTHLLVNMITLFFFGPTLELIVGPYMFVSLYLLCLVLSGLPSMYRHRNNPAYATLGASGAVSGILFSYILYLPLSSIFILYFPVGLPALAFGALYLGYTLWESRHKRSTINHEAHLAGALSGLVLTLVFDPESLLVFLTSIGVALPLAWLP